MTQACIDDDQHPAQPATTHNTALMADTEWQFHYFLTLYDTSESERFFRKPLSTSVTCVSQHTGTVRPSVHQCTVTHPLGIRTPPGRHRTRCDRTASQLQRSTTNDSRWQHVWQVRAVSHSVYWWCDVCNAQWLANHSVVQLAWNEALSYHAQILRLSACSKDWNVFTFFFSF